MSKEKTHPRIKRTVLPKVTREMVLEENPDLAWTREDSPHTLGFNEDARLQRDYAYEGRSTG